MPQQNLNSWKSNYGLQLLVSGGVVGLMMCLLWYGQWLPEIQFGTPEITIRQRPAAPPKNFFVARILGPKTSDAGRLAGAVLLYTSVEESSSDQRLPVSTIPFELDSEGTATVVHGVEPGRFAAIAYLDSNQNGQLDLDSNGNPEEPFCSSSKSSGLSDWRDLKSAEFNIEPASTYFSVLQFKVERR